jgi:hypothetical protein
LGEPAPKSPNETFLRYNCVVGNIAVNIFNRLKLLCLVAIAAAATATRADTFLNTLAWTRYIPVEEGHIAVDELGNTYVDYITNDAVAKTFTVHFIRYDLSGNGAAVTAPVTRNGSAHVNSVTVTPLIGGKRSVFVLVGGSDSVNASFIEAVKLNESGVVQWDKFLTTNSDQQFVYPIIGAADPAGDYYIADEFIGTLDNVTGIRFQSIGYDPAGNLLHCYFDTSIIPDSAQWVQGRWIISGNKNGTNQGAPRWVDFDPTKGTDYGQADYPTVDNLTYKYTYGIQTTTDSAGFVYLLVKVSQYRDSDGSFVATNHFIRKYSASGSLLWTSKSFPGDALSLTASTYGSPLWVSTLTAGPDHVEQFDSNGNLLTNNTTFTPFLMLNWYFLPDTTGTYLFYTDATVHKRLNEVRIGPTGSVLWNLSVATTLGGTNSVSSFIDYLEVNGNLYTSLALPSGDQIAIQRYVRGTTISSISGGTVSSNSSLVLKVSLNAVATAGGLVVNMTSSNAKLLFPNNSTAYSLAIPAGSVYANVTVHSGVVAANTTATVSGNQNGVIRAGAVTLIP